MIYHQAEKMFCRETFILFLFGFACTAAIRTLGPGQLKLDLDDGMTPELLQPLNYVSGSLPVVLWHGMGDSCCSPFSIGAVAKLIEAKLGVFVHSVNTGSTEFSDVLSGFWGDVNDQVALVCAQLRNLTQLKGGYNAVGFSQGGQFLRAVAERCQHTGGPLMRTLVTMGAQHQGVMNVPGCRTLPLNSSHGACYLMQKMLGEGAYLPYIRDHVVQAQYFKDPLRLSEYLVANPFLPDINNERGPEGRNPLYGNNLASLERLVLYRFSDDDTVVPRDSAWFSFFDGQRLVPLYDQPLYKEDWIGLRSLDERGQLVLEEAPGAHMQFTLQWFADNVIRKYLYPNPEVSESQ
ncbi:hypothetical protein VOLCADRAFT_84379 [Volvox carteri f. nagariensis]|uniref:Palmitoyl-protein thioesterase 1 n=1 Tax=Volvox carteri f. nagariensis TaxID=3068 RepID=D8UHR4_VOLCA|nr:uncharacterized protein VOLCADRAFT_84379 [Volvox carteri f. nagariensis]EFJ40725.1 hypothetical protein VOLCADRAFT_84379 [Volvox carteri f. nagariensis]|eukprot:XP_002958191.1 hypothetical protein VOLCADRAFT_84379 [Volvox carteri f. nagariensis]